MLSNFSLKLEKIADHAEAVGKALGKLAATSMLVGVPEEKGQRKNDAPINNPTLAYIHENGSDRAHIPAREFMRPGIKNSQGKVTDLLEEASSAATRGDEPAMERAFNKAGQTAVDAIRDVFVNNNWVPVTKAVQRRKGEEKNRPLIDTGQLRKSIIYVKEVR